MTLQVIYEGVVLAEGLDLPSATEDARGGLYIPLEAPMPVGTLLHVVGDETGGERRAARVARVRETERAGVFLGAVGGGALTLREAPAVSQPRIPSDDSSPEERHAHLALLDERTGEPERLEQAPHEAAPPPAAPDEVPRVDNTMELDPVSEPIVEEPPLEEAVTAAATDSSRSRRRKRK